jgi:O-antigen/teichoic acid export membrane protein
LSKFENMSKLKQLAGDTVLYGLGSIVPRALNFLLLPLQTKNMFTPAEYGVVTNLFAWAAFLNIVFLFGMETAFFRFASKPEADQKKIFHLTITCVLLVSLPISISLIVFSSSVAAYAGIGNHPEFITWLTILLFIDAMVAIPFARLRIQRRPLLFATAKISNVLIVIALNYYFLKLNYNPEIGVGYVFLANLIANGLYLFFFIKSLAAWRPTFDAKLTPQLLRYAYPVMLTGIAGMINEMGSRISMEYLLPKGDGNGKSADDATGILGVAYKFAVLMNLAVQSFRFAAEPFFFSQASDKNSPELFARVNHFFVITCCFLLLTIGVNLDLLKLFTGEAFYEGLFLVPTLLLSYLLLGVYYNVSVWFKLTDKTYYGTWITVGGALITIIANVVLVPYWGYAGSAYASVLCYLFMLIVCYQAGQRHYPIPYRVGIDASYIIVTMALVVLINSLTWENILITSLVNNFCVAAWLLMVYLRERKELIPAFRSKN